MFKPISALVGVALLGIAFGMPALADSYDTLVLTPPAGTNTGAGSTASVAVSSAKVRMAKRAMFIFTDPTVTVATESCKLQATYDGTNWADVPSGGFANLTATGSKAIRLDGPFGYKLRYYLTNDAAATVSSPSVSVVLHY